MGPRGIALDREGNLYIATSDKTTNTLPWHDRVRKVDQNGIITTVAGTAGRGYNGDGMPATQALLFSPQDIVVDADGNLYIADMDNHRIRKVDRSGKITTFAGTGSPGYSGEGVDATQAMLKRPYSVALDGSGKLYISEPDNLRVRVVLPNGTITTVAGNGSSGYYRDGVSAIDANIGPLGLALDGTDHLYIASDVRVLKVFKPFFAPSSFLNPGERLVPDGGIGYVLAPNGDHRATVDLASGQALFTFGYDGGLPRQSSVDLS